MMQGRTPPPTVAWQGSSLPALRDGPLWSPDDATLALSLFTTWAARTGRELRAVPVTELTAEELVEFWADDQLEMNEGLGRGASSIGLRGPDRARE